MADSRFKLARRIKEVQPSATLAVDAKAKALQAEGRDIVAFAAGEPDFRTPEHISAAGIAAISNGDTYYSAKRGAELSKAICTKFKEENGLDYKPSQILISNGAKHTLYNLVQVLVDEGDEVIIPAPYWVSYLEQVRLAGGKPVIIPTDESTGFKITPVQLERSITAQTRVFMFNSPSNPTGAMYTPAEIRALAAVIEKYGIITISDEIYEHLAYTETEHLSFAKVSERLLKELVVTVNGVSKTYAMTGWRIGYCAGPEAIVQACAKLQSHATSAPASFSQAGACEAYVKTVQSRDAIKKMLAEFDRRRLHMTERLNALRGIKCLEPLGAFYCFPNISGVIGRTLGPQKISSSMDLVNACLEQANVALVPGEAFGSPNHIRLSYAVSMETIDKGLDRLERLLNR